MIPWACVDNGNNMYVCVCLFVCVRRSACACVYGYSVYFGNHFVIPENCKQVFGTGDRSRGKWLNVIFRKLWCHNSIHTELVRRGRWVIQRLWGPPPPHKKTCRLVTFWKTSFFLFTFIAHWLLTHDDMMVKMNDATDYHEHRVSVLKLQFTSSCSIGCTSAPDCYVTRTLPVLLLICDHFRYNCIISNSLATPITKAVISVPNYSASQPSKQFPQSQLQIGQSLCISNLFNNCQYLRSRSICHWVMDQKGCARSRLFLELRFYSEVTEEKHEVKTWYPVFGIRFGPRSRA